VIQLTNELTHVAEFNFRVSSRLLVSRFLAHPVVVHADILCGFDGWRWIDTHMVVSLLDSGVYIETKTIEDWKALHLAVMNMHSEIVVSLLGHGADI